MQKHPNILWVSVEDTSPRFGCYGDRIARTPHIDRLAEEGVRYTHAFSTAPSCAPSRSTVITGMYAVSIGTHQMRTRHVDPHMPELQTPYDAVPPHYVKMFSEYLRGAGYYCTNNGKTDYQFAPSNPALIPVTGWDDCSGTAHWRNREAGQPFFAVFNTVATHESQIWRRDELPLLTDPDQVKVPPYLPDTPKVRRAIARQYDNIAESDAYVGKILKQLEEDGLQEETIVFLWSDHGEGLPRAKHSLYDGGIRVPLIVRWPGMLTPGAVSDQLVSLVDLAPTVLSLAGVDVPAHLQGQPFLGPRMVERDYVFTARDRGGAVYDMVRAVRGRRYKYIRNYAVDTRSIPWSEYSQPHPVWQEIRRLYVSDQLQGLECGWLRQPRRTEELYDCESDEHELNNLIDDPQVFPILDQMRQQLDGWRARYGDLGELDESDMVARMWPGGVQPQTAQPVMVPLPAEGVELGPAPDEGTYPAPIRVLLSTATQGASIAYTFDSGPNPHWRLYTEPIRIPVGRITLRAKAERLGYRASQEQSAIFDIREPSQAD